MMIRLDARDFPAHMFATIFAEYGDARQNEGDGRDPGVALIRR